LLFFHIDLNCYIAIELKNSDFKPEYMGQLSHYVVGIDKTVKTKNQNQTIGILLCKKKDKESIEWSLNTTNLPIGVSSFEIKNLIPKEVLATLPVENSDEEISSKESNTKEME